MKIFGQDGCSSHQFANYCFVLEQANQFYHEAEHKIINAGNLGHVDAYFYLACAYSLSQRCEEAVDFLEKDHKIGPLPSLEELLEEDWLDNLHGSLPFSQFIFRLETKQKAAD